MPTPLDLSSMPEHVQAAYCGALLAVGSADGNLTPAEKALVLHCMRANGMSEGVVDSLDTFIKDAPTLSKCLSVLRHAPEAIRRACLENLSEVASADGVVERSEQAAIDEATASLADEPTSGGKVTISKNVKVAAWAGLSGIAVMLATPFLAMLMFGGVSGAAIMAMLAWLGSFLGGGAVMGLAVLMASGAAGGGVAAAITAAIASRAITDPDQLRLSRMVIELNELLEKASSTAKTHEQSIRALNDRYGQLLKDSFEDKQRMSSLEAEVAAVLQTLHGSNPHH